MTDPQRRHALLVAAAIALLALACSGCRRDSGHLTIRRLYSRPRLDVSTEFQPIAMHGAPVAIPRPSVTRPPPPDPAKDSLGVFYAPRLLMPGEDYSEWAPRVEGQTWFGLYQGKSRAELRVVTITIEPFNVMGDSVASGGRVKVSGPHKPLFLVRAIPGVLPEWRPGPVAPSLPVAWMLPGDRRDIRLSAGTFRIEVTGKAESGNVTDYELRLRNLDSGASQVIFAYHPPAEYAHVLRPTPAVTWVGDLDRDGKPDILIQDDMSELAGHWTLYLSSAARRGEIVHRVAEYQGVGC
ncbi:MAG: hypothetical protein ABSB58_07725 [Gemmatimonadales bacterium]|jgi:hypothetical protein